MAGMFFVRSVAVSAESELMSAMRIFHRGLQAIAGVAVLAILGITGSLLAAPTAVRSPSTAGVPGEAATAAPARAVLAAATSYTAAGGLNSVAAAADNNAWAVGYSASSSSPKILVLHWNGSAWSKVTRSQLKLIGSAGDLYGITVVNAKDAYAVGYSGNPLGTTHTLLLHWNGIAWSPVTSPAPVSGGALSAVTATTKGGWALGYYATGPSALDYWSLAFRLNGVTWSRVSSEANDITFTGVATTSAGTSWATANEVGMITGSLAKWSGSGWNWIHSFPVQGTYHALNAVAGQPGRVSIRGRREWQRSPDAGAQHEVDWACLAEGSRQRSFGIPARCCHVRTRRHRMGGWIVWARRRGPDDRPVERP